MEASLAKGRLWAALLVVALVSPALAQSADTPAAPTEFPPVSATPNRDSAEKQLRLLEARYGELKRIYARDAEELDDLKARHTPAQPAQNEEADPPEIEALLGTLSAVEGQLKSMDILRQRAEEQFSALSVQSEERVALAASELQACTAERSEEIASLRRDLAGARGQVSALLQDMANQQVIKTMLIRTIKEITLQLAASREGVNRPGSVPHGDFPSR